mmetsp:Transcript_14671/g.59930  ORF Transcript_14671/g.59930 Transcript_14671/m.59930 type:complete len:312 (+) Transcript_14671:1249-2184(+)
MTVIASNPPLNESYLRRYLLVYYLVSPDAADERGEQGHQTEGRELEPLVRGRPEGELPGAPRVEVGARGELGVLAEGDGRHGVTSQRDVAAPVHERHPHRAAVGVTRVVRVTENRLAVTAVRDILVRRHRTRGHHQLGARGDLPAVLELGTQRQRAAHEGRGETRGDLVDGAKLPPRLSPGGVGELLANRLDIHPRGGDQLLGVMHGDAALEPDVAVLFVLGQLAGHVARVLVEDDEALVDAEPLDAALVVPTVSLHDGPNHPLGLGLEEPVPVTDALAVEGRGKLGIRRGHRHLLRGQHLLLLVLGDVVR